MPAVRKRRTAAPDRYFDPATVSLNRVFGIFLCGVTRPQIEAAFAGASHPNSPIVSLFQRDAGAGVTER